MNPGNRNHEYERLGVNLHKQSQGDQGREGCQWQTISDVQGGEGKETTLTDVDHLIWAFGRTPKPEHCLEEAGVKLTEKGYVVVEISKTQPRQHLRLGRR